MIKQEQKTIYITSNDLETQNKSEALNMELKFQLMEGSTNETPAISYILKRLVENRADFIAILQEFNNFDMPTVSK